MKTYLTNILLLSFISFFCCNDDSNQNLEIIDLDRSIKNDRSINYERLFSDINIIFLELTEKSTIYRPHKLILDDKYFYILERGQTSSIKCFNLDGNYIFSIENPGRGPYEYSTISSIGINNFSGYLELLDPRGKLISYDLQNNRFVEELPLFNNSSVRAVHDFLNISPDLIVLHSNSEDLQLHWFSKKRRQIIKSLLPNKLQFFKDREISYPLKEENNNIYFLNKYTNSLHIINNLKVEVGIEFEFGKHDIGNYMDDEQINNEQVFEYVDRKDIAYPILDYFFNLNCLQVYYRGEIRNVLLKDNTYSLISGIPKFSRDFYPLWHEHGDQIIGLAPYPKRILNTDFFHSLSENNKNIISTWEEGDNPLVFIFLIKL